MNRRPTVRRVEQWLPGFSPGDAVSRDALGLQNAFRKLGIACEIGAPAEAIAPSGRPYCRPLADLARAHSGKADGVARIYHYAIGSPLTAAFMEAPRPRILRYHNITPAGFFRGFDDRLARRLRAGRDELPRAADAADAVWAVSRFNAAEIEGRARARTYVLPLLIDLPHSDVVPPGPSPSRNPDARRRFTDILFVGRLAPNKRIEELILAFDQYRRRFNPRSRLLIVGSPRGCPRYAGMLWMLAAALRNPAVCFEGFTVDSALNAYYRSAALFVSASLHEGFGAPMLEAMAHGPPVMARRAGGVPEAMDGAGILFENPTSMELAELMAAVLADARLRAGITAAQNARVARWRARDPSREVANLLACNINPGCS